MSVNLLSVNDLKSIPLLFTDDVFENVNGIFVFRPLGFLGKGSIGKRSLGANEQSRYWFCQMVFRLISMI